MSIEQNPYAPPAAAVFDVSGPIVDNEEVFHPQGISRSAGHGWLWIKNAWRLFKQQKIKWWFALFLIMGGTMLASLIPFANMLTSLVFPMLIAGVGVCAASVQREGKFKISMVFEGFSKHPGRQMLAGLLYLLIVLGLVVGVGLLFGMPGLYKLFAGGTMAQNDAADLFAIASGWFFLTYFAALMLAFSTIIFAPFLIHEHGLSAPQAMLMSARACLKNILSGLVAMMCFFLLAIVASIPLLLGWLALFPVMMLVGYTAYRDIFFER